MNKIVSVLLPLALVFCAALASCPFSVRYDVSWDPSVYSWVVNGEVQPMLEVVGGQVNLFNISSGGGGDFFISTSSKCNETNYALGRKDNVTNNACTPPCTVAFNLTSGHYFYCSSVFRDISGYMQVLECNSLSSFRCGLVTGCGWSKSDRKCKACHEITSEDSCGDYSGCEWCPGDEVCLDKESNACRDMIELDRPMPSWVWLFLALFILVVLIIVFAILFLAERGFKQRWSAMSKMDKDFAEVGKGANDGLSATD